jgi:hypothetical protein
MASAPPPPEAKVEGAVQTDTMVSWEGGVAGATAYVIRWRPTDAPQWQQKKRIDAHSNLRQVPAPPEMPAVGPKLEYRVTLPHIRVDGGH